VALTELEVADDQLALDEVAVKHLIETEDERLMADQSAGVRGVQPPCQTLA
jgi:hypothetical protein